MNPNQDASRTWRWVAAVVSLLVLAGLFFSIWDRQALLDWMARARPFPFFAVMALAFTFGVPPTPFLIVAGATFGTRVGIIGSILVVAAYLSLCYWVGGLMRPVLAPLLNRFGYRLPDPARARRNATMLTLGVRFAPGLPAFVKNYGLVLAGVPFATYFAWSFVIGSVYAVALITLGESLFSHDGSRIVLVLACIGLLAIAVWWWRRAERHHANPPPFTPA